MEIIIGACVSLLTQGFKWMVGRYGMVASQNAIILMVLLMSFAGAVLYERQLITPDMLESWARIGTMSIGIYEIAWKRIIKPVFDKD